MFYYLPVYHCRHNGYQRKKAVEYAVLHAKNPNPAYIYISVHGDGGGDCTNFISQCLRSGGAPMAYDPISPWWYDNKKNNDVRKHTWSLSWSVAHSLYWCLKVRSQMKLPGLKGIEVKDMDMLELGDLIQYENSKGTIYHSTIISSFTIEKGVRVPLISQHSFDALNIPHIKPAASSMHFMKIII